MLPVVILVISMETVVTELHQTLFSVAVGDEIKVMLQDPWLYLKDLARLCDFIWYLILFLFHLLFTHKFYTKICNYFHGIYFLSNKCTAMKNILGP